MNSVKINRPKPYKYDMKTIAIDLGPSEDDNLEREDYLDESIAYVEKQATSSSLRQSSEEVPIVRPDPQKFQNDIVEQILKNQQTSPPRSKYLVLN